MKRLTIIFSLFLASCAAKVHIQSDPSEAEVFVSHQGSTERKSLGKTPIDMPFKDFEDKAGNTASGEPLLLTFELKEYESEKILVPSKPFGIKELQVAAKLSLSKDLSEARDILQRLHNAQKLAKSSQFERALIEVDKVLEVDPKFARALSLKGSIFYLQKRYDDAITWLEKAIAVDPGFTEALDLLTKVKNEKGK